MGNDGRFTNSVVASMCILTHEGDQEVNVGLISFLPKLNIFPGQGYIVCCVLGSYHSSQNHHVIRALVVETCREEKNKCKSFVKMQIIASRGQGN